MKNKKNRPIGREAWFKYKDDDKIWWAQPIGVVGTMFFSFDKKKEYSLFRDYPYKLSEEEKELFDKENPDWAEFFENRNNIK